MFADFCHFWMRNPSYLAIWFFCYIIDQINFEILLTEGKFSSINLIDSLSFQVIFTNSYLGIAAEFSRYWNMLY